MTDTGLLCSICLGQDHRASTCPNRRKTFLCMSGWAPRWYTRALFVESYSQASDPKPELVRYTLKPEDVEFNGQTIPSLHKLYLSCKDLTEYTIATTYLGGWEHWQELVGSSWFIEYLNKWRTELEVLLKSEALQRVREEAEADGRNAFAANKFLIAQGWIDKKAEPNRRGRPSKAEIKQAAVEAAFSDTQIEDDLKRLEIN